MGWQSISEKLMSIKREHCNVVVHKKTRGVELLLHLLDFNYEKSLKYGFLLYLV